MESHRSEDIFQVFLDRLATEDGVSLDSFCEEHPEHAGKVRTMFRGLCKEWEQVRRTNDPADPERALREDFTLEYLNRLRARRDDQRYRRLDEIARGAQGRVYRVWDDDFRRHLAMKVSTQAPAGSSLKPRERAASSRNLARLIEEAQVTGQLDHPGVVPIHDLGLDADGRFFFTMRLVHGKTLTQVFDMIAAGEEGWTLARALGAVLKVCETMAFAHAHGVVHRDLKPSNIMVGRFGELYVMDWGLARVLDAEAPRDPVSRSRPRSRVWTEREAAGASPGSDLRTRDGDVVGTPAFMSPEQAEGDLERIGPPSDIYSVGAILYRLLSGLLPYQSPVAPSQAVTWDRVVSGPPEPLEQLAPDTPPELIAITQRAMERDPDERYESMERMGDDLRAFLEDRVVTAYRTGPIVEFRKWVRRNRAFAAAAAALVVLALAGSWLYTWNEARRAAEIRRYAAHAQVEELLREAAALGPTHPDSVAQMEAWIEKAQHLTAELEPYERQLERLREQAEPIGADELQRDVREHPQYDEFNRLADLVDLAPRTIAELEQSTGPEAQTAREHAALMRRYLPVHQARHERVSREVQARRTFRFASANAQRVHDQLAAATRVLASLREDELPRVSARCEAARTLARRSVEAHARRWAEARRDIATHGAYGFELEPQIGLVPIGLDPTTGMWEFWHVLSGTEPRRGEEGELIHEEDMGIVLVLLPALSGLIGGQREDATAPRYDPLAQPGEVPHDFDLEPFFLSKFEMTQAQWLKLTGNVPSYYFAGSHWRGLGALSGLHPVESVTWRESMEVLERVGLELPTEAQWELAARAGADTPFHFGGQFSTALGINLAGTPDGHVVHAPVGGEWPNPLGLHDLHGNVRELCRDLWTDVYAKAEHDPATGELLRTFSLRRALRGASFAQAPRDARLAYRMNTEPDRREESIGLRPARRLHRGP